MTFQTVAIVDWSGGNDTGPKPKADAIWAAVIRDSAETDPVYLRNRNEAFDWLTDLIETETASDRPLLLGFDFPFAFPRGTAARITGTGDPLALWDWLAAHLEDTPRSNSRFHLAARINGLFPGTGPFWFNGLKENIPGLPHRKSERAGDFGVPDRRATEEAAAGTFACWQMGGAGAVGSQAFTGMATLAKLRARHGDQIAFWPFETRRAPVTVAEVYPSLLAPEVRAATAADPTEIKDRVQVRLLARALARLSRSGDLEPLLAVPPGTAPEEGWILGVGHEATLRRAARPDIAPPRLDNDCFTLPPGVDWLPVDDALARLRDSLGPITATETIATIEADGRILSSDVIANRSNPPSPNAAVDGFGFAAAATGTGPQILPLHPGRAAAGAPFKGAVPQGSALRILTGAILPKGVDTIVLEEDTTVEDGHVAFEGPIKPGANTRKAGEDVSRGDIAFEAGHRLRPQDIALLSALDCPEIESRVRLRVGVLSTGDELIEPGQPARTGQIHDANRPMLLSLADRWHHAPVDLGIAADTPDAVRAALNSAAASADVILTSGGASAGDEDHISRLLREEGAVTAWRIALKPGRPLLLGQWQGTPVFGLPGNPVAAFVCALIFARPALSVLAGGPWTAPQAITVPAAFSKDKKPGRREYLRARLTPECHAEVFPSEGSGRISGLSWAQGLVEIEDGPRKIREGDPVRYLPFAGFGL